MSERKWTRKHFKVRVGNDLDQLRVEKLSGSDWIQVKLETHGRMRGDVELRGREIAQQLHFVLGQLLEDRDD